MNAVGFIIRELRESLGLTQEDLSLGICTQSQLSRIEKGGSIPSVEITFQLAQRLNIDLDELYQMAENPKKEEVISTFQEIRKAVQNRNYNQVEEILKGIKKNPLFQKIRERQFIIWHEGIIAYYLYNQKDKSLRLLQEAFQMRNRLVISEREIEIKNSMGIIYCEIGQLEQGIYHFEDALKLLTKIKHIKDFQIELRLYYNLAKTYTSLEKWNDALVYCEKAIQQCIHHSTFYSFGELYYQQGECLLKIGDKSKGEQSLKKAISIFELIGNESFANETRNLLNISIKKNL